MGARIRMEGVHTRVRESASGEGLAPVEETSGGNAGSNAHEALEIGGQGRPSRNHNMRRAAVGRASMVKGLGLHQRLCTGQPDAALGMRWEAEKHDESRVGWGSSEGRVVWRGRGSRLPPVFCASCWVKTRRHNECFPQNISTALARLTTFPIVVFHYDMRHDIGNSLAHAYSTRSPASNSGWQSPPVELPGAHIATTRHSVWALQDGKIGCPWPALLSLAARTSGLPHASAQLLTYNIHAHISIASLSHKREVRVPTFSPSEIGSTREYISTRASHDEEMGWGVVTLGATSEGTLATWARARVPRPCSVPMPECPTLGRLSITSTHGFPVRRAAPWRPGHAFYEAAGIRGPYPVYDWLSTSISTVAGWVHLRIAPLYDMHAHIPTVASRFWGCA
ncbi:hypothetical protein BD779DRAFT_1476718 [Infundibulicybe gibba]|nr:hypothetical protein BD779DRAFT_1476718 [Infundibulicybe gibba]